MTEIILKYITITSSHYNLSKAKKLGAENFARRPPIFLKNIVFVSKLGGIVP